MKLFKLINNITAYRDSDATRFFEKYPTNFYRDVAHEYFRHSLERWALLTSLVQRTY